MTLISQDRQRLQDAPGRPDAPAGPAVGLFYDRAPEGLESRAIFGAQVATQTFVEALLRHESPSR